MWRNDSDYAYTENLTFRAWAWEFLRRNADYRREWATCSGAKFGLRHAFDPALRADEVPRAAEPPPRGISRKAAAVISAPKIDFVWWRTELLGANVFALNKDHVAETVAALPDRIVFLAFDLDRPTNQQLTDARRVLSQLRKDLKPKTRAHLKLWRLYLRAFDAREQEVALKEIAAVLFENPAAEKEIWDALRQVQQLIASGYRPIISLEPIGDNRKARKL